MVEPNGGDASNAEQLRRLQAGVSGDYVPIRVNQDRIYKAEAADAFGKSADLLGRVSAGITGVRPQRCGRELLNLQSHFAKIHSVLILQNLIRRAASLRATFLRVSYSVIERRSSATHSSRAAGRSIENYSSDLRRSKSITMTTL